MKLGEFSTLLRVMVGFFGNHRIGSAVMFNKKCLYSERIGFAQLVSKHAF